MPSTKSRFTMVERICRKTRSGKTTHLKALAIGYAAQGKRVLFVTTTQEIADIYRKHLDIEGVLVSSYKQALDFGLSSGFDVALLDDCHRMESGRDQDPVDVFAEFCERRHHPVVIIGTYTLGLW